MRKEKRKRTGSTGGSRKGGRRESRMTTHVRHADDDRLKDDLSQCGVTRDENRKTLRTARCLCSLVQVVRVVIVRVIRVGVLGVTVVHIGYDEVLVVI